MKIDRRRALALLGVGAAAPAAAQTQAEDSGSSVQFMHGVASGDPGPDRVIIWTRVSASSMGGVLPDDHVPVTWEVARNSDFSRIVARGRTVAQRSRDMTVKVDVRGLKPGTQYFYRFKAGGSESTTGLTRTLPVGPTKDVVLAVASCALYPNGYFHAYGAIASLPRVDAVLHLGDYIYEYGGPGSYGMDSKVAGERPHDPPHECVTLEDYRRRHAQYKRDYETQAAHTRAPWIVVWDDHETANDSYSTGAQNHQPKTEGDWDARKAAAIKAYYEWMPIREPKGSPFAINRSFDFGDVASLFMVETRLTARDQQIVYERDLPANPTPADFAAFWQKVRDPARKMMSAAQEAWLRAGLAKSVKSGRTWQVLGNEVVMARVLTPPLEGPMGPAAYAKATEGMTANQKARLKRMEVAAERRLPWTLDMWDGYPADRQRLYGIVRETKANCIVVSGDSHSFWANELYDAEEGGRRVAVEFGTTGITSPGGQDALPTIPYGDLVARHNREVLYNDQKAKGFVLLTLTKNEAKAEMVGVSTITEMAFTASTLKTFRVKPGPDGVSAISGATKRA